MTIPQTADGYKQLTFEQVREEINGYFVQRFGSDVNLDDVHTLGMISAAFSLAQSDNDSNGNAIYHSLHVLTATGKNLDDIARDIGLQRHQEAYSSVDLQIEAYLYDDSPVIIPAGTEFSTPSGERFATIQDLTFDQSTKVDNLVDDDGNQLGQATATAYSVETGYDQNVAPGSIVNIYNNVDGFYSVTNPNGATGGSDVESDEELRNRILLSNAAYAPGSVSGIVSAINSIPGVSNVSLVNNRTMQADKYGNPPKSIHLYVTGGDEQTIAQTLANQIYSTTQTMGSITEQVTNADGQVETASFDRPNVAEIYIEMDLSIDPSQFDTDNAPQNIRNKVVDYFSTLKMGDPVKFSQLFNPANSQPGVKDVTIKLGTDPNNLSSNNVQVSNFQLAQTVADDQHIIINISSGGDNNV